jgi:hypothetical protein
MDPRKIEESSVSLSDLEILDTICVFQKGDEVIEVLNEYQKIGVDRIIIFELNSEPEKAMRI